MIKRQQTTLVFVYGTLRKGFRYHPLIQDSCFRGSGKTVEKYALYISKYPGVLKDMAISHIYGEVYEVDEVTLAKLDELEDHPHEYRREEVLVVLEDDSRLKVWLYFYPRQHGFLEVSGDYAKYARNIYH